MWTIREYSGLSRLSISSCICINFALTRDSALATRHLSLFYIYFMRTAYDNVLCAELSFCLLITGAYGGRPVLARRHIDPMHIGGATPARVRIKQMRSRKVDQNQNHWRKSFSKVNSRACNFHRLPSIRRPSPCLAPCFLVVADAWWLSVAHSRGSVIDFTIFYE